MKMIALITGASSGIGRATALLLAEKGFRVYGVARRTEKMEDLHNRGIRTLYMDVQDNGSMERAVDEVLKAEGRIDALVNNAGFGIYGTVEDVPIDEARRQFEVNVFGLARITQLVLPAMREQRSGHIVNLSSVAGRMSMPLGTWYHASKHAVEALSDSLRMEVAPYGISIAIIEPGIIDTAWWPIAEQNLEKVSRHTVYSELVEKGKKYLSDPGKSSPPSLIAETIFKALTDKHPKTRYLVGEQARKIVLARQTLPDRTFDKLLEKELDK